MNGVSTFIQQSKFASLAAAATLLLLPGMALAQTSPCDQLAALAPLTTNMTDPSVAVPNPSGVISPARQRASALFRALTGVQIPIDDLRLACMEAKINKGDERGAIQIASKDPLFYDIRVRDVARKMSTRLETITAPVSDFVATFVGVVRDSDTTSAKQLLTGNFTYQADVTKAVGVPMDDNSLYNTNAHYDMIQSKGYSLMKVLKRVDGQKVYSANSGDTDNENAPVTPGGLVQHPDPAGLITTRAFHMAHAIAGTNRRMFEYTMREFMCQPIGNFADITPPEDFIGRDVDRAPSGDHGRFEGTCKGCHAQMDGIRPAFAKADFVQDPNDPTAGKQVYNSGIGPKYARNKMTNAGYNQSSAPFATNPGQNAPIGYRVQNTNWKNFMTEPHNMELFGWRSGDSGAGMGQFAAMVANSQGFSRCMVKRVFSSVCRRDPASTDDALMRKLAEDFESDSYHLRHLFESVALRPECVSQ